jgi:hypothetical protein
VKTYHCTYVKTEDVPLVLMTIRLHFYGSFFLHNPISKFRVSVRRPLDSATSTYINIVDST